MTFELKVGDKVEIIDIGLFNEDMVKEGDVATYEGDSMFSCPTWKGGQFCYEEFWSKYLKPYVVAKIKFPCCVPISEIKDQDTFNKIFDLFIANGADEYEKGYEEWKDRGYKYFGYKYFGVDYDKDTMFYKRVGSYSSNDDEDEVTTHSVAELLGTPTEDVPVEETPTLLPVGTEVKIAESSEYYACRSNRSNPIDTKGIVRSNTNDSEHLYWVEWDSGVGNCYKLNDLLLWEDNTPKTSQEAITDVLEDKPSVGVKVPEVVPESDYPKVGEEIEITGRSHGHGFKIGQIVRVIRDCSEDSIPNWGCSDGSKLWYVYLGDFELIENVNEEVKSDPLLNVELDISYKVTIKGVEIKLTQEELDEVGFRLGVLTSYNEDEDCE